MNAVVEGVFHPPPPSKPGSSSLLLEELLAEQSQLHTAVADFSKWHDEEPLLAGHYRTLIPLAKPGSSEQYAFEVKLDECTGCKACVAACHSLNGLDDDESWRDVGTLITRKAPVYQQTVTTACHHCEDPACANGCPVLAYEKDAETGIVRHLDDQCMGCSYCILKCPYEVPKFNLRLGIVRKCDMCSSRLAEGEAPACVQACPNAAIGIQIVPRVATEPKDHLLPGVVRSDYTRPTTRYVSNRAIPSEATAADEGMLRAEHTHWPLVVMLVLTQAALGLFIAVAISRETWLAWIANGFLHAGLAASALHLGQPLRAWRAFLGWRKSWLSREILVFSGFAGAGAAVLLGWSSWGAVIVGTLGVLCSIMVYVDTRRPDWSGIKTTMRFAGTALVFASLGLALLDRSWVGLALLAQVAKLGWETWQVLRHRGSYFSRMHLESLPQWSLARLIGAGLVLILTPLAPALALAGLLVSEMLERALYFKTVKPWRMPGA